MKLAFSGDGCVSRCSPAQKRKGSRGNTGQDWNTSQRYVKKFACHASISSESCWLAGIPCIHKYYKNLLGNIFMQTCFFHIFLKLLPCVLDYSVCTLHPHPYYVFFMNFHKRGTVITHFSLKHRRQCRNANHNFRVTGGDLRLLQRWKLWLPLNAFGSPNFFVRNQEAHNCFTVKLRASWLLQTSTGGKHTHSAWTWLCSYWCFVQIQGCGSEDLWPN